MFRHSIIFLGCVVALGCSGANPKSLGPVEVCALAEQIDIDAIDNAEMADNTFDQFALRMQDLNVKPELKEVLDLLIGADAKDTYQLYLESGQVYGEDWSCAPLKKLLSVQ